MSRVTCHAEEQGLSQHAAQSVAGGGHGVVYFIIYLHYAVANTEHRAGARQGTQLLVFVSVFGQQQSGYPG